MAKSGFWLRGAKGKLAGTVLYSSGGSTVQREIVTPKNPQSDNQMRQRATFAGAAKFYQNAQQNRFVLAFQNKKNNQSNFNAFMQKNLREFGTLPYPTKEQANTPEFCNFFPWICTEGNLQSIPAAFPDDSASYLGCAITASTGGDTFAKDWDELIAINPALNLQYGDIITLTIVLNDEVFDDATSDVIVGSVAPRWITRQFIIGDDLGSYSLGEYLQLNGFEIDGLSDKDDVNRISVNLDAVVEELGIASTFSTDNIAAMVCVTRSRQEGSQLKVSSSRFELDDMAQRIYERMSNDTAMRDAIASYRKTANSVSMPTNILQGSVAEGIAVSSIQYTKSGETGETSVPAPATGLSVKVFSESNKDTALVTLAGVSDLVLSKAIATAEGWTVERHTVNVNYTHEQGSHSFKSTKGAQIKFTRATGSAGSTIFNITYAGVVVASGNLVKTA